MMLRRITLERYGCFGSTEFAFRPGMNLISGGNDSGKTLLLMALPAALFGVENGSRLRSWGDMVCCRVTLLFEDNQRAVRLTRDLESNLVRLEERGSADAWQDCFVGLAPPLMRGDAEGGEYQTHLTRLLAVDGIPLLRALLDPLRVDAVLDSNGRLAKGLWPLVTELTDGVTNEPSAELVDARVQEIATLEAELADDRSEYQKGQNYLNWIRKRWQLRGGNEAGGAKSHATKSAGGVQTEQLRQRDQLFEELRQLGLPGHFPEELPAMFATAESLRLELAALQLEMNPLQRRKQAVSKPSLLLPLAAMLVSIAAVGGVWWALRGLSLWLMTGCAAVTITAWGYYLFRWQRARTTLAGLEKELQAVELRRGDALIRQLQLAEQFEAHGLPSAPVEMVKLQQLYRRHGELINRYRQLCAQLGEAGNVQPAASSEEIADKHLRPEELPEAEARLAALAESLRVREDRLQELRAEYLGKAKAVVTDAGPADTEKQLLAAIGLHLDRLSAGRYRELRLEEGCLRLALAPGRWAPLSACSRSAATCLTLAVRMALAGLAGCRLPLPVDDLTQLLDLKRRQTAIRWLERFARDSQVLLASGDQELAKRAQKEAWQVIRLDLPTPQSPSPGENTDAGQLHLL